MILTKRKSSNIGSEIANLVEEALVKKGVSARRASMDVVGHDGLIRDIRAGRTPSFDRISALFEYLDINLDMGGKPQARETIPWGFSEKAWKTATPKAKEDAFRKGYLPIPYHRDAGPDRQGAAPIAFSRDYLRALGVEPEYLTFVVAVSVGTPKGDVHALVNSMGKRTPDKTLWAYIQDQKASIANLSWPDQKTLLIENPDPLVATSVLTGADAANVRLLGRVVWTSVET